MGTKQRQLRGSHHTIGLVKYCRIRAHSCHSCKARLRSPCRAETARICPKSNQILANQGREEGYPFSIRLFLDPRLSTLVPLPPLVAPIHRAEVLRRRKSHEGGSCLILPNPGKKIKSPPRQKSLHLRFLCFLLLKAVGSESCPFPRSEFRAPRSSVLPLTSHLYPLNLFMQNLIQPITAPAPGGISPNFQTVDRGLRTVDYYYESSHPDTMILFLQQTLASVIFAATFQADEQYN